MSYLIAPEAVVMQLWCQAGLHGTRGLYPLGLEGSKGQKRRVKGRPPKIGRPFICSQHSRAPLRTFHGKLKHFWCNETCCTPEMPVLSGLDASPKMMCCLCSAVHTVPMQMSVVVKVLGIYVASAVQQARRRLCICSIRL